MYIYNMHIYIVMQLCRARTFFICKLLVMRQHVDLKIHGLDSLESPATIVSTKERNCDH